jgi:hypothetical protein
MAARLTCITVVLYGLSFSSSVAIVALEFDIQSLELDVSVMF